MWLATRIVFSLSKKTGFVPVKGQSLFVGKPLIRLQARNQTSTPSSGGSFSAAAS